ncbi:RING finger domain and kelch repeat-containing protein DDB_G0271372-like [Saccostrea cucullata]|uniref:RING finger domain and kelch repeat-containing protein DDB_G0271372-like n=1 Tax=Saccostrea cuccullata TaxID=36930 RepID=UPI002ED2135A
MDQNTCDLKCPRHDVKLLPIYCEDCECPVCSKCLTTSHLNHNVCDANDYVEKQWDALMAAMNGEGSMLEELRSHLVSQRKILEESKTKLFDEISVREENIISVVREVGKHYKSIVSDAVVELKKNIQKNEKTLENISNNPKLKTESEIDCIKLLQRYGDLRRLQGEMKNHQDPLNFTFVTGKSISRISIEELFGNFNGEISHIDGSDEDRQIGKSHLLMAKMFRIYLLVIEQKRMKKTRRYCMSLPLLL